MNVQTLHRDVITAEGVRVHSNFLNGPSKAHPSGADVLLVLVRDNPGVYLPPALHWGGETYTFESDGSGPDGTWTRYVREL